MSSYSYESIHLPLSFEAMNALRNLEYLGYDIDALLRMNMDDKQIIELCDEAYRYRRIEPPNQESTRSDIDDFTRFFRMGIDLSLEMASRDEARIMVSHFLRLAEKVLSRP